MSKYILKEGKMVKVDESSKEFTEEDVRTV